MNNKGFTLIELIATIALLAIVVTISFVSINAVVKSNKIEQCNNLVSSIEMATKEYVSDNRYKDTINNKIFTINDINTILKGYITLPIIDPNTKDDITGNISVNVELNDDYTVKNIVVYGINCDE